ncbi:MAG TPA: DNA alkylation repair protein [Gemmatimonadaceae bacterium]|jgi:3-methyladenine DNA glycosylase AlkD
MAQQRTELKKLLGKKKPPTLTLLRKKISAAGTPARAEGSARYFKTGKGEYGEGDKFLGLNAVAMSGLAREARGLSLEDTLKLLHSAWHEERAIALLILVDAHKRGAPTEQQAIRRVYLASTKYINNWDLVDSSAPEIIGAGIEGDGTKLVERLAKSKSLWERRIAMVATQHATRRGDLAPALLIAERLLGDAHDLMHKAVGWMLREVGKRDSDRLRAFLKKHAPAMPRTALRYSIERFAPEERKRWLGVKRVL